MVLFFSKITKDLQVRSNKTKLKDTDVFINRMDHQFAVYGTAIGTSHVHSRDIRNDFNEFSIVYIILILLMISVVFYNNSENGMEYELLRSLYP